MIKKINKIKNTIRRKKISKKLRDKIKTKKQEIERKKQLERRVEEKIQRKELEPIMEKYGLSYEEAKIYAKKIEKERKKRERREKLKNVLKTAAKNLNSQRRLSYHDSPVFHNDRSDTLIARRNPFDFSDIDQAFGFRWSTRSKNAKEVEKDPFDFSDLEELGFGGKNKNKAEELEKMLRF